MKEILLNGHKIPYKIAKKNNKHTYFYFKKAGYVQINLAKHQRINDAIQYMQTNADAFVTKFNHHCITTRSLDHYYVFGEPYDIVASTQNKLSLDPVKHVLYVPEEGIDQDKLKTMEKDLIQTQLHSLIRAYQTNPYVDLNGVKYSIRSMVSRFGSCSKSKRRITINLGLVHYDKRYLEYVFLHEIAHLVHDNHSKEYYALLETLCPNYKQLRKELKEQW